MKNAIYKSLNKAQVNIDKDVFEYGWYAFKQYFTFLIIMIPLSILTQSIDEFILFIISFIPFRKYLGGFHFNNAIFCTFFSILFSIIIVIVLPNSFNIETLPNTSFFKYGMIIFLLFSIIVSLIGPVDHPNKQLCEEEKQIFKQKALITLFAEFVAFCGFLLINKKSSSIILYTTLFCLFNLLCGKIRMLFFERK